MGNKKTIGIAAALVMGVAMASTAYAATANWTGKQVASQSVTGRFMWNCEYQYAGQMVWYAFPDYCRATVEVQ